MATAIDWLSDQTHIVYNPLLKIQFKPPVDLKGHIWIRSSGTTGVEKWIALGKKAFLAAAKAANSHVESTDKDIWLSVLPDFHVGGLSIFARAFLSGAKVLKQDKWDVDQFLKSSKTATLTSLVPTQVSDLVTAKLKAPLSLRAIIVGGGNLSQDLYHRARELGWPVLPSFGMTECCSQIATATLETLNHKEYPPLTLLSHIEARASNQILEIKSEALCTGIAIDNQFIKTGDWLVTQDRAEVDPPFLVPLGRSDDQFKILGELVDLHRLQTLIPEVYLFVLPHLRNQNEIVGVIELSQDLWESENQILEFNKKCLPFERITSLYQVTKIPLTPMGKVERASLKALL